MKNRCHTRRGSGGFTLVEMLVSLVVFLLLMIVLAQMINSTGQAIIGSRKLLNMDDQARLIFGRMASDFSRMLRRNDVDIIFSRETGGVTSGGDDKLFFFSTSAATNPYLSSNENNPLSLIGYCIAADAQSTPINANFPTTYLQDLHRLGRGLSWDTGNGSSPDNMVFLTYSSGTNNLSSTIDGHWSATSASKTIGAVNSAAFSVNSYIPPPGSGGTTPSNSPPTDSDYHVIGDQVIRFEYCFLLNNGTYSNYPAENVTSTVGATTYVSNLNSGTVVSPKTTDDSANDSGNGYFCIGSRWFNCSTGRAYICTSATPNAAVWISLGAQDISAIIVAIVLVDRDTRNQVASMSGWQSLPRKFLDPTDANLAASPPVLMQQSWQAELNTLLTTGLTGVPNSVLARTRIYQRNFYLNTSAL